MTTEHSRVHIHLKSMFVCMAALVMPVCIQAQTSGDVPIATVAASSQLWPKSHLNDGDLTSLWSSNIVAPNQQEWIAYWFDAFHPINYIKLRPRFFQQSMGFPVTFTVYWSNGYQWNPIYTKFNFPAPSQDEWVVLPLPATVQANGIHIVVYSQGHDDYYNYVFQLSEVGAGYDSGFEHFRYVGNNGAQIENRIQNVGSGSYDPAKISNWNFDYRRPLIQANQNCVWARGRYVCANQNIYAPTIVKNSTAWAIYFGGWDGTSDGKDRISILTTDDDFKTFSPHYVMIDNGQYTHVNNGSAIKISDNHWRLYYTTLEYDGALNKPAVSVGTNGIDWSPSSGTFSSRLTMTGDSGWANADVNGSNVIYYEGGLYHLYYSDMKRFGSVFHATSVDGVNFNYQNIATVLDNIPNVDEFINTNDVKSFTHNLTRHYLAAYHTNGSQILFSKGTTPANFDPPAPLLTHLDNLDAGGITSVGFVTGDNRLYGLLYGATLPTAFTQHSIYAAWLQKKVIFENSTVRWGDVERAYGPDDIIMYMDTHGATGRFKIYDTDGTTLLFTSPLVTMQEGDQWQFIP